MKLQLNLRENDLVDPEKVEVRVPNSQQGWNVLQAPTLEYQGDGVFEGELDLPKGTEYKFLISPKKPGAINVGKDANGLWVRDPRNPHVTNEGEWNENSVVS